MRWLVVIALGIILSATINSCQLRRGKPSIQSVEIQPDLVGYWLNIRSYRLANGALCVDLIDSSHARSRYTLLFQRYRWVDQASRPAAAELALRWLLAESTSPNQISLSKEIQLLGGQLEVLIESNFVGLHLEIEPPGALQAIERLVSRLSAPRWDVDVCFQVRDEMAARRAKLESDSLYARQDSIERFLWANKRMPASAYGNYDQLMSLRPDSVKAAYRSLWFGCPKAHVFSAPNMPETSLFYATLERIPNRPSSECAVPVVSEIDSVWLTQVDTIYNSELLGLAHQATIVECETDSMAAILPAFWAYVVQSELLADLCRKRSLTCRLAIEVNYGPQTYIQIQLLMPVVNATLERFFFTLDQMRQKDVFTPERWRDLKDHYRFEWYLARRSPASRHAALVAAAGAECVELELAVPNLLPRLSLEEFRTYHCRLLSRFNWLFVGRPEVIKPASIARLFEIR